MPIFGLPFTLDDNERRRRIAEQALSTGAFPRGALTPPINPDSPAPRPLPSLGIPGGDRATIPGVPGPSSLPETISPRGVMLSATTGIPGGERASIPGVRQSRPPTRVEELAEMKDAYVAGAPGRFKSGLVNALRGFAAGVGTGGGLGAGLGGALAGGAFGAINPRGAREMEFERFEKPKIFERFGMEDQEKAARMAAEKGLREEAMQRAQIANVQSQIGSRAAADALNQRKFDLESGRPIIGKPGDMGFDPKTRARVFEVPTAEKPPTVDEVAAALTAEEGTIEEVSQGSLRGRLESLKQRLTPDELRIVEGRTMKDDAPETIARAQAKWQKIQNDEFQSIRRDTGERRKAKVSQRRFGRKGQPGRTAISVSEAADLLR